MGFSSYTDYNIIGNEDVAAEIALFARTRFPLLDLIGDSPEGVSPQGGARNIKHEWVEDALNSFTCPVSGSHTATATAVNIEVDDSTKFRVGDVVKVRETLEVLLVTTVSAPHIVVTRSYGGSTIANISDNYNLDILGNADLEGQDAKTSREVTKTRGTNYTQIFSETVNITDTEIAVAAKSGRVLTDIVAYEKQARLIELLGQINRTVMSGIQPSSTAIGSSTVRRTMDGIVAMLSTNVTDNGGTITTTEARLNAALKSAYDGGADGINLIVCNSFNKRQISSFISPSSRYYGPNDNVFRAVFGAYESDFGVQQVLIDPDCPRGTILMLDTNRIKLATLRPLAFKELARTGSAFKGQWDGELTLELRNEKAHAVIYRTTTS